MSYGRGSAAGGGTIGQVARVAQFYSRVALAGVLVSLAIVLHIPRMPFPPVPFLKFDGVGIPLAVLALHSVPLSVATAPILFLAVQALGADIVGAGMKVLAELSTFIPLALAYRRLGGEGLTGYVASACSAVVSRVAVMTLANYLIAPHWILMAGWAKTYEEAYAMTSAYSPWIAVFNAIVALYVAPLALAAFKVLRKVIPR